VIAVPPVLLSTLARALRVGRRDLGRAIVRLSMGAALLLVPFAGVIAGAGTDVAALMLGGEFAGAGPLLPVLLAAALVRVPTSFAIVMVVAAGRIRWTYVTTLLLLPVAIVGYVSVVPAYGATGAAAVTLAVSILGSAVMALAVYRAWDALPPAVSVLASVVLGAIAYWASASWPASGLLLVFKVVLLAMVVPAGLLILAASERTELRRLRQMLPQLASESVEQA
jgi:O-antigen/teichoic acid export membrane protein